MSKSLSRLYQLSNSNSEIKLRIEFGQLQRGVTTVMLNDNLLLNNGEGVVNLLLGSSNDLKEQNTLLHINRQAGYRRFQYNQTVLSDLGRSCLFK